MEALALEISKILNITVEKAIELMPIIRSQFIKYSILDSFNFLCFMGIAISGLVLFMSTWEYLDNKKHIDDSRGYYESNKKTAIISKNIIKPSLMALVLFIMLDAATNMLQYVLAPDFMLFKQFMLK